VTARNVFGGELDSSIPTSAVYQDQVAVRQVAEHRLMRI
jgi:hypothetical protein